MQNYYDVLGAKVTSSREELKQRYLALIRENHPDKNKDNINVEKFHLIDKAWKVLCESSTRHEYDAILKASETSELHPVHEEIFVNGMLWNSKLNLFSRDCRCGGKYVVDEEDMPTCGDKIVIDCDSCSLSIVVESALPDKAKS